MSSVEHWYQSVPGNFTFEALYDHIALTSEFRRGVEIGVANGRSASYLAAALINAGGADRPSLGLVDNSQGNLGAAVHQIQSHIGNLIDLQVLLGHSPDMAAAYEDGSLDFVMIDGEHRYDGVAADIKAWLPKVRAGGILAGHDYVIAEWSGVIQAVTEAFPHVEIWRGSKWDDGNYYPSWVWRV